MDRSTLKFVAADAIGNLNGFESAPEEFVAAFALGPLEMQSTEEGFSEFVALATRIHLGREFAV